MLPSLICKLIAEYVIEYDKNLLDWIDINKINWKNISFNPNAINLLRAHPDKIYWYNLSYNRSAIELLKEHPDKINWYNLSYNHSAIELLTLDQ